MVFLEKEVFFSCKVLRLTKAQTRTTRIRYEEKLPVFIISWRTGIFYVRQAARIFFFLQIWNLG